MAEPVKGVTEYDTPDGFHVIRVHYTADPAKCDEVWIRNAKQGTTPSDWAQEMEIDFTVVKGKPWYPEFNLDLHVSKEPLSPLAGVPIVRGWDYGLTPATVYTQVTPAGRVLVLYPELQSWESGILQHANRVMVANQQYFGETNRFIDYGDPAGNQRAQTDERTCTQVLREEFGIIVRNGPIAFAQRDIPIRKLLTSLVLGQSALIIDFRNEWLIEALRGGYRRMEVAGEIIDKLDDNKYTHIVDALGYAVSMLAHTEDEQNNIKLPRLGQM